MHFERFPSSNVISRKKIRISLKNLRRKVAKVQNRAPSFSMSPQQRRFSHKCKVSNSTPENNRVQVTGCSFVGKVKTMMEEGYCALTGNGKLQLFKNLTLFVVVNPKCGNFSFQDFFVVQILREINFGRS